MRSLPPLSRDIMFGNTRTTTTEAPLMVPREINKIDRPVQLQQSGLGGGCGVGEVSIPAVHLPGCLPFPRIVGRMPPLILSRSQHTIQSSAAVVDGHYKCREEAWVVHSRGYLVPKSRPLTKSISAVPCGQPANGQANMQKQFVTTLLKIRTSFVPWWVDREWK